MKKHMLFLLLGILVGILSFGAVSALAQGPVQIIVNGDIIQPDVPPQIINGRTMVPIRFVAEALGANVQWDAQTNSVIITTNNSESVHNTSTNQSTTDFSTIEPYYMSSSLFNYGVNYSNTRKGAIIKMAGNYYENGVQLSCLAQPSETAFSWNLNSEYNTLSAVFGFDDSHNTSDVNVIFEGNGNVIKQFHLTAGSMSQYISIPVSGVNQLTIRVKEPSCAGYIIDLANATLQ
ncbi:copper amine oxidase N-terminal domain-containing protein [Pelotomaculum isophthalicicum JI]|uniref:Copper amine oxidase N-terminal domain-containing protein n=1 Tax=Pelotomaculum isophthalicicum JI TaxID=947010 RepID=A0A9X4JWF7_9FIRM|nr:copper amine oxidase N-terminal domain-containing protein [Pelotomaculum isophthalicicum]MDF9410046.1 copper amine oxidase N-terminal domain-containing protein [Pelotomaculum isophthalicicum JI]